jgi:enoyl-CoA hydratase
LCLATDLRIVGEDLLIRGGFSSLGIHPGGGHYALLARVLGSEAAAAIGLFGEEIRTGAKAVEVGFAWLTVPSDQVVKAALDLARKVAADPALARKMAHSFRSECGPPALPMDVAAEFERGSQMWSLRRRS